MQGGSTALLRKKAPGPIPLRFLRVLSILFDSTVGFCQKLRMPSVLLADVYVARVGMTAQGRQEGSPEDQSF